jgi:hypothetical protein
MDRFTGLAVFAKVQLYPSGDRTYEAYDRRRRLEPHSQKTERAARQHPYIQIAFAAEGLLKPKDQEA